MTETLQAPARPAGSNFIGGRWSPSASGRTYEKRNPARPSEIVGEFALSSEQDAEDAVRAAGEAFPGWAGMPGAARGAILLKAADAVEARVEDIARDMTAEMGKPLREARMEAARAAAIFRFFAGEPWRPRGELYEQSGGGALYTQRRPLGVVEH